MKDHYCPNGELGSLHIRHFSLALPYRAFTNNIDTSRHPVRDAKIFLRPFSTGLLSLREVSMLLIRGLLEIMSPFSVCLCVFSAVLCETNK